MTDPTKIDQALKLRFKIDVFDDESVTVKEFLEKLLLTLWEKKEEFSGKRPFGNSGWEYALAIPLVEAGLIKGELSRYDDIVEVESFDKKEFNTFIRDTIQYIFA